MNTCKFVALTALLICSHVASLVAADSKKLDWAPTYEQAVERSKKESKPLFLYFTGSDWCGWCIKMDKEILENEEFANLVGDKFVFYAVDFPIYVKLDPKIEQQNDKLKENYKIQGFPTIILVSPNGKPFATLNYREGGGKSYGDYLVKILAEQHQFENEFKNAPQQTTAVLQKHYERACHLGLDEEKHALLQVGLTRNDSPFFLKEQYRELLSQNKVGDAKTKAIREKLLAMDPENKQHVQYDVAILDFEALSKKLPEMPNANAVIAPLKEYLNRFGAKDEKHRWKIEMTIYQVLLSKNQMKEALEYAKASQSHAPARHKVDIAKAVNEIQQNMSSIAAE